MSSKTWQKCRENTKIKKLSRKFLKVNILGKKRSRNNGKESKKENNILFNSKELTNSPLYTL